MNRRAIRAIWERTAGALLTTMVVATAAVSGGCGGDDESEYTLTLIANRLTLTADGRDFATIQVSTLDSDFAPPTQGSEVTLVVAPSGNVNETGATAARAPTNDVGIAEFRVSCTGEDTLAVVASFGDARGRLNTPITCQPAPAGDWTIVTSAEPRRILPGGAATVRVRATTPSGDPVPDGTSMSLTIPSGDMTFGRGGQSSVRTTTGGVIEISVQAGTTESTATICADFTDSSFGSGPNCVAIVVSAREVTEANCIGTLSSVRAPADGQSVTTVTMTVSDRDGNAVSGAAVTVAANAGTLVDAPRDGAPLVTALTTDAAGDALAYIVSPAEGGSADLSAEAIIVEDGAERVLACEFSDNLVFFGAPSCRFEGMAPELIGVTNSGIPETGTVRFCFEQTQGVPVPAGTRVEFEFELTLTGLLASATTALTDDTGCASIEITAGRISGLFEVRATVPFGNSESTCTSGALPVRHGRPTANGWNMVCSPRTAGALSDSRGIDIFSDCPIQCQGFLRDRFGNPVNSGDVLVYLASEQGIIESPITPSATGEFVANFIPNGTIPADVTPLEDEPFVEVVDETLNSFGRITGSILNPRDSLITIVAYTIGEEAFFDEDGDGYYDDGETFVDLPEPFVDKDDNDVYTAAQNPADAFIDTRTPTRPLNGVWDDINRQWEANTVIWTRTAVAYHGFPIFGEFEDYGVVGSGERENFSALYYDGDPYFPGDEISLGRDPSHRMTLELVDQYLNQMGPGTTLTLTLSECPSLRLPTSPDFSLFNLNDFGSTLMSRTFRSFDEAGNVIDNFGDAAYATIVHPISSAFRVSDGTLQRGNSFTLVRGEGETADPCLLTISVEVSTTPGCSTDNRSIGSFDFIIEP